MSPDPATEIRSLASGVRALAAVFLLFLSYFNVRLALQIGPFGRIFSDMLGGKQLPWVTTMVLQGRTGLLLLALAIPVAAIVMVAAIRSHKIALYGVSALIAVAFLEMHLIWAGLFAPFMAIMNGLQATQ